MFDDDHSSIEMNNIENRIMCASEFQFLGYWLLNDEELTTFCLEPEGVLLV